MVAETALQTLQGGWRDAAGAWLAQVQQRTGSARTPQEYARHVAGFLDTMGDPSRATTGHVHAFAYGAGLSGREPSPSTVIVRLAAVSSFYDFARRMGLVATNPADDVRRPRNRQPSPRGLDLGEVRRLLEAVPPTGTGARDRAIILTAIMTGLRRQEIMGLRAGDLTRNGAVYYNVRAKGGTYRRRELPAPAFSAICGALETQGRALGTLKPEDRLFDVSHQGFAANLQRHAHRAGLEGVTPHVLRHTAAKLRRDNGASIEDVSALLGHRSIATTARYLARLEGEGDHGWHAVASALGLGG